MYHVQTGRNRRSISYQTISECLNYQRHIMSDFARNPHIVRESDNQPILKLATNATQRRNRWARILINA
jgi:hypothetical protein